MKPANRTLAAADYAAGDLEVLLIQLKSQIVAASISGQTEEMDIDAVLLTAKLLVDNCRTKLDEIRIMLARG